MTEKEIAEIRRRFNPEKTNISRIRGCYVNEKKEIVSEFNQSFFDMSETEADVLLHILKRTLSGTKGKNLVDIEFSTNQVLNGEEQKMLLAIRDSELADNDAATSLFQRIAANVQIQGNFIIFLAFDKYDVFSYGSDGSKKEDSDYTFAYYLCSICPVKLTKPALSYYSHEHAFHSVMANSIVCAPELGFMYPTFDERTSNIYNALMYTKNTLENRDDFVDSVFKCTVPMPAKVQKQTFESVLSETVAEECSYDVVQTVHEQLSGLIAEHKESKDPEPLYISKSTVKNVLEDCGVNETKIACFEDKYDTEFGKDAEVLPQNVVDVKQFEIRTPDVVVKVNPERSDLVKTRIIDGAKYILIRADEDVQVNGINIRIGEDEE